jgi:phosphonate transport system substrate-binding protein
MNRLIVVFLACFLGLTPSWASEDKAQVPLRIAVVPYLTTSVLLKLFEPIRQQLELDLKRPVELYTAPDIRTHVKRILKPDFDAVLTAAHMGRMAQLDAGYVPVAGFESPLRGIVSVHKNSSINTLKDIKGRTLSINDRLVLVSIVTLDDFETAGVNLGDIKISSAVTQNSSLLSVAKGDVDAAVTAIFTLNQIPEAQRQDIRTIHTTEKLPNVMFLANRRLSDGVASAMSKSLIGFGKSAAGEQFFSTSGFNGIVPLTESYMKTIDRYVPETRRILASEP